MIVESLDPRVLFVDLPQLPRELIEHALADLDDIWVVGAVNDVNALGDIVRSSRANLLIVGSQDAQIPESCRRLVLGGLPPDIIVMASDGRPVTLVVVRPRGLPLGNPCLDELVTIIRRSVGERAQI
jgi:hypothetical protein